MKLFVGLGNPGDKYSGNRHNIGFMAVERIARAHGFSPWRKKFNALVCDGDIGGERVTLLKPETFMNDSGRAVGEAMRFLKIEPADVVVFHDELDLLPNKIKVKIRRRQCRPQRLALDLGAHRQRLPARPDRHRPSGLERCGRPLRAQRLRQVRARLGV